MKFLDFLIEQKDKHAVMAFGRMNPITSGHQKLVNKVKEIAKKVGGSHHIILSHSQDPKKNPLSAEQKVRHAKRAFPGTNFSHSTPNSPNFLTQAGDLHKAGITHLHVVGGSDRVDEFKKTLEKYNGTHEEALFNFKKITVHSAGERDPDAEGVTGISASKMREHASKGNFEEFKKGAPSTMSHEHVRHMYNDVRRGMNLHENINEEFEEFLTEGVHDKSIFKAVFLAGGPGSGKDYVLDNTLAGHGLTEINSDKALEFLMDKEGLDKKMPESEQEKRDLVRGRAKNITELRQRLALFGRNGLIINGTGDDPEKIKRIKDRLEEIGYDTSMVMVNTADEVSQARNIERGQRGGRTVPEKIRKEKWDSVQAARPELAKMFGNNYSEFDNSEDLRTATPEVVKSKKDEMLSLFKNIRAFVSEPPNNPKAQEWIASEMQKKDVLPIGKNGVEKTPHPDSMAADEAKKLGLQYYGFGRYGKNGKVTYRSVNDKLVKVEKNQAETPNLPVPGSSMRKRSVNEEFDEYFSEDLRQWFDPKHPKGGWKRINTKGEVVGPCAREPGEAKPKCMSNEKIASLSKNERAAATRAKRRHDPNPERKGSPINVSNYGKGKLSEQYDLSDSSALNLLLMGTKINEVDFEDLSENKKPNLLKGADGKIRVFMLRRAAAKEAHQKNGTVLPYKNGYVIKLNEENEDVQISEKIILEEIRDFTGEHARTKTNAPRNSIDERDCDFQHRKHGKITLSEIYKKQKKKVEESIDKGIEPGLSMASSGENLSRPSNIKNKQIKKPFEETIGAGGEMATSMSDQKEDELKKRGISLSSFKAKRPIG